MGDVIIFLDSADGLRDTGVTWLPLRSLIIEGDCFDAAAACLVRDVAFQLGVGWRPLLQATDALVEQVAVTPDILVCMEWNNL